MFRKLCGLVAIGFLCLQLSGCAALIGTALSAAAAYGVYQATRK